MTQINPLTLAVPFFFFFGGVGVTPGDGSDDGGGVSLRDGVTVGFFGGLWIVGGTCLPLCASVSLFEAAAS